MMRRSVFPILLSLLILFNVAGSQPTAVSSAKQPKYCLFITVDAMDRDYMPGAAPNLMMWEKQGVALPDAINIYPTLTTPNMTSLVTGSYPETTTIGSNRVFLKDNKQVVSGPRFNQGVTIAEAFKSVGLSTAGVQHFMLKDRGSDVYATIEGGDSSGITEKTLEILKGGEVPRLMAVLYQKVDSVGHKYGSGSSEAREEMKKTDAEIARIVKAYQDLGIFNQTMVVISSDHGMSDRDKPIDLTQIKKRIEAGGWTYQSLDGKIAPDPKVDFYHIQQGNMQCYFNRPFSQEERERLFDAFRGVEGVGTVFNETMLRRMHAHPNAGDFIVESAPGYWFGGEGGVHGRNTESDPYLMIFGCGVRKGVRIEDAETVDLVPTILYRMGIAIPPSVDGKVLREALEP